MPCAAPVTDDTKGSEKLFEFDHCFGPNSTQEEVFGEVEALVTSVLDGYNVINSKSLSVF